MKIKSITAFALVNTLDRKPWIIADSVRYRANSVRQEVLSWWNDEPDETQAQKWQRLRKKNGYRIVKVLITAAGTPK